MRAGLAMLPLIAGCDLVLLGERDTFTVDWAYAQIDSPTFVVMD